MVQLRPAERADLEATIDVFLKDPSTVSSSLNGYLLQIGIEPNIDTIMAMYIGSVIGLFASRKPGREKEYTELLLPWLERRVWEIRQTLIKEMFK